MRGGRRKLNKCDPQHQKQQKGKRLKLSPHIVQSKRSHTVKVHPATGEGKNQNPGSQNATMVAAGQGPCRAQGQVQMEQGIEAKKCAAGSTVE